jgi:hypothetical protein
MVTSRADTICSIVEALPKPEFGQTWPALGPTNLSL